MQINVNPVSVFPNTAVAIRFAVVNVLLGNNAYAKYELLGADDTVLARGDVATTSAQYAAWGSDDGYIVDCFLDNLGLVRA